jgi:transposase
MANRLTMAKIQAILSLHEQDWPNRKIARKLEVDRETVTKYVRAASCAPEPAKAPIGSDGAGGPPTAPPEVRAPDRQSGRQHGTEPGQSLPLLDVPPGNSKPAKAPIGSEAIADGADRAESPPGVVDSEASANTPALEQDGSRSACEPYRQVILEKLDQGLSAQRIYQDLVGEGTSPLPFRRMECASGEEAQVDFGTGAWIDLSDGKRRRSHVFRIVLSFSRKAYSEAVFRQTTEDFIRCLENAFWHFGGVPKVLVIDNLKAAVKQPDWYDPELNPKIQSFCEHYGVVILPTKPRTPRHKGKVESGVGYVQDNGLKGHRFPSLEAQNEHLGHWETTVADTRLHGTIRKQVGKLFQEVERQTLRPLPTQRFPFFHEGKRSVHRDGHVEIAKAYYSVPPEYLGHTLWVRWDLRLVRQEPGRFSTLPEHLHAQKQSGVERGAVWLLSRARLVGTHTARWAENMLQPRGIEGVRVLQGLLALTKQHDAEALERLRLEFQSLGQEEANLRPGLLPVHSGAS